MTLNSVAVRDESGLGDRVLSVEDALVWLRQTFEPAAVELPYVVEREAYAVDKTDSLFDGLRADYPGFDAWYDEKCAREHRKCWVVDVGGALAGLVVRKDETRAEAKVVKSPGERILKLCTFIMGAKFRGEKFGEQLLKQCLWFGQANGYDVLYVTAFPNKEELIQLLSAYGFIVTGRQDNGELVIEKALKKGSLFVDDATDLLGLDRMSYPRFYDGVRAAKYCVPIQGAYHEKLFPEISFRPQPPLFAAGKPRALSGRLESAGDSQIGLPMIPDMRRQEAARDGAVVTGFAREGGFRGL